MNDENKNIRALDDAELGSVSGGSKLTVDFIKYKVINPNGAPLIDILRKNKVLCTIPNGKTISAPVVSDTETRVPVTYKNNTGIVNRSDLEPLK